MRIGYEPVTSNRDAVEELQNLLQRDHDSENDVLRESERQAIERGINALRMNING